MHPLRCFLGVLVLIIGASRPLFAQEDSPPAALAMFADAANFQNNGAFELAAEEWQKFLKQYPRDPLFPKALHYAGVCQMQLKNFGEAVKSFQTVLDKYPKFEMREDTWLNLGWCQFTLGSPQTPAAYAQAVTTFTRMLDEFPKGKHRDQGLYFLGESQYAQGKKAEAIAAYRQVVEEYPESKLHCDATYALGVAYEDSQNYEEALATYETYLSQCGGEPLATEVRMRKAECLLQTGKVKEAEGLFAEVAAVPQFVSADLARSRQAFAVASQDRFAEAAELYARIPAEYPQSPYAAEARISAGRCWYRAGELDSAAAWFKRVVDAKDAFAAEAAHWLCRILLQQKDYSRAQQLAQEALAAGGDSPFLVHLRLDLADALYETPATRLEAYDRYRQLADELPTHEIAPQARYNAAFAALQLQKFDEGRVQAREFLKAFPQDRLVPDVRNVAAECALQAGQHAEAAQGFQALLADFPQDPDREIWHLRLGLSLYLQQKYDDAIAALNTAFPELKSAERQAEAHFLVGSSQFQQEKFDAAQKSFTESLQANDRWRQADEALLLLSRTQAKRNELSQARATVERLLQEFPQSSQLDQAHYRLGEYQYAAGEYAAAAASYQQVLDKWPDSTFIPYALYGRGWSLLKQQQFAAAAEQFTKLLEAHGDHLLATESRFARALCRRETGEAQAALKDLEAYLSSELQPEAKAEARYQRALLEIELKQPQAAVATLESILSEHPQFSHQDKVLYELGWVHKGREDAAAAVAAFRQLAQRFPKSPLAAESHFHVGEDQYARGDYQDALQSYAAARSAATAAEIREQSLYKTGWSQFQLADYEAARQTFGQLLQDFPQSKLKGDGLFMQGESLFKQQKYPAALEAFQAAEQVAASTPQVDALVLLHGAQSAAQLERWSESVERADRLLERFPDSPYAPEAYYERGWAAYHLKQPAAALKDLEQAANRSRDRVGAQARFMMGEILFDQKEFAEAVKQFQRVMFGFGGDAAPAEVKTWQVKAAQEAARCLEVQVKNTPQPEARGKLLEDARRIYRYLVEKHPQDPQAVAEARRRLDELGKL